MADETRSKNLNPEDARRASSPRRDTPAGDEQRDANDQFEPDDVAEDRNLSGSTTWLTLPDQQPKGEGEPEEGEGRK